MISKKIICFIFKFAFNFSCNKPSFVSKKSHDNLKFQSKSRQNLKGIWFIILFLFFCRSQGITDERRLTCTKTITNKRISLGEKTITSHIQENIGFPDIDYDGKKSSTAVGRNRTEVIDHYTCTSGGKYLDKFEMPKPKIVDGIKEKLQAGLIIAIKLHEVLRKFLATTSTIFVGADSCATNTGDYMNYLITFILVEWIIMYQSVGEYILILFKVGKMEPLPLWSTCFLAERYSGWV